MFALLSIVHIIDVIIIYMLGAELYAVPYMCILHSLSIMKGVVMSIFEIRA